MDGSIVQRESRAHSDDKPVPHVVAVLFQVATFLVFNTGTLQTCRPSAAKPQLEVDGEKEQDED